jgi:outer membrane cobalamin receptor
MNQRRRFPLHCLAITAWCGFAHGAESHLTELDLSTLMTMDVTVTSAARRAQSSSDAAAAVFVLTRDDIRRSGATSIPQLLRGVPGVEVGQISASSWAVTARGFNGRYANKLLVLIDGRTIYTPSTSGVLWEDQREPLEEIERIVRAHPAFGLHDFAETDAPFPLNLQRFVTLHGCEKALRHQRLADAQVRGVQQEAS